MNKDILRRVRELERDNAELAQRNSVSPTIIKASGGEVPEKRVIVLDGNTLATGQDGINYTASEITDIPSDYDPDSPFSGIDGVGRGALYTSGSFSGYVLVVNDGSGGTTIDFDLLGGAESQDVASVATTKSVTVASDPLELRTVYVLKSLIG
jgi:hypothetical protein